MKPIKPIAWRLRKSNAMVSDQMLRSAGLKCDRAITVDVLQAFEALKAANIYVKPVSKPRRWLARVFRRAAQVLDKGAAPATKRPIPDWRL